MIPEKKVIDAFKDIAKTNDNRLRAIRKTVTEYKGDCVCCRRKQLRIVKVKPSLCNYCYNWCKKWIVKEHGYYSRLYYNDAIAAFRKPIKCRFYVICGNEIDRINEDGTINIGRSNICDKCKKIYQTGLNAGSEIKRRTKFRRGQYGFM